MTEEETKQAQIDWAKKRLSDTIGHLHELVRSAVRFSIVGNGTALGIIFAAMKFVTAGNEPRGALFNGFAFLAIAAFITGLVCGLLLLLSSLKEAELERQWRREHLKKLVGVELDVEPDYVTDALKRHHDKLYDKNIVSHIATLSIVAICAFVGGMAISLIGTALFLFWPGFPIWTPFS